MPEEIDHYKSGYICKNADEFILNKEVSHVVFDFEEEKRMKKYFFFSLVKNGILGGVDDSI